MRNHIKLLSILMLVFLTSCGSQPLDQLTLILTYGVDIDQNDNLVIYTANPVFSEEAKEAVEILHVKADSIRESRNKINVFTSGIALGGKLQNFIVSKRLVKKYGLYPLTDVFYRDPKAAINANVIVYDGEMKDLLFLKPKAAPRLSIYLRSLVDTAKDSEIATKTTLQSFHRQVLEKGMTPSVTELRLKNKKAYVYGSALLDNESKYVTALDSIESSLLLLLKKDVEQPALFTILTSDPNHPAEQLTFSVEYAKEKIKTTYKQNRFVFDISLRLKVLISEGTGWGSFGLKEHETERKIKQYIQKEASTLIKQFQKEKVDPIGLGIYARAYEYKQWKKVQNNWSAAFVKADIQVHPQVKIISFGMRR